MYINKIKLQNFRNYKEQEITFNNEISCFYGDNAQGKTNILEAIFVTAMGKSFRTKKEKELIKINEDFAFIEVEYKKTDREGKIKIELSDKKNIYLNGVKLNKLSDLIGNINVVIFSPEDIEIIKNGPEKRRKFLNMMISQLRPAYIYNYNMYFKTLEQRNNYLKQIKFENKNKEMLDIWDEKLVQYGTNIFKYRNKFINKIKSKIGEIHSNITQKNEKIEIKYISESKDEKEYLELLKKNREKDIIRGYTSVGVHRDDFVIYINEKEVNIYGSQGQQRTSVLSLKLSELYVIYDEINEYPILLLDDFMSELDEKRIRSFFVNIREAQVLITGTHKLVLDNLESNIYNVVNGKVKLVE